MYKTAHRRRRGQGHGSRRKNSKSRKMMKRGGGRFTTPSQCTAGLNNNLQLKRTLMTKYQNFVNPCTNIMDNGGYYTSTASV